MAEISKNAFLNDDSITEAKFGENCYTINDNAFEDCNYLIEINDENHIKNIGNYTFKNATSLSKAIFDHLETMGSGAFEGCENLTKIEIPNCANISNDAFSGCQKLTSISLKKCGSIGSKAFKDCETLEHVYINNPDDIFCELEDINAFKKSEDGTIINENIEFHVNDGVYGDYINEYWEGKYNNWHYYINNIVAGIRSNQIRYKATNVDDKIDLIVDYVEHTKDKGYWVITFNDDVTSLNQIFTDDGKKRLISIELPFSCETIGESAFSGCENLKTIIMPNVKQIKDKAFENCKELTSFEMPESVATLGEGIFKGCDKISSFKGKFSTYGGRAIVYNSKLISVVSTDTREIHNISDIDKTIWALGAYCFEGCVNMRRVNIPSNIVKINEGAFENCTNLYEINLNRNYKDNKDLILGADVFKNIDPDYKIFVQESELEGWINNLNPYKEKLYPKPYGNVIIYYINEEINTSTIGRSSKINNKNYTNGKYYKIKITNAVPSGFFANKENITKVITSEETIGILDSAFYGCSSLEYVYLSEKIKALNKQCFYNCKKLKRIHIPSNININIGESAFANCESLKTIDGCNNVEVILNDAFKSCKKLENFALPNTLRHIGAGAFEECEKYDPIIPKRVLSLGDNCFKKTGITELWLSSNLEKIPNGAFENCTSLKYINIVGSNITEIGYNAFKDCVILEVDKEKEEKGEYFLPDNVTIINDSAFENCNITYAYLPKNLQYLGNNSFLTIANNIEIYIKRDNIFIPKFIQNDEITSKSNPFGDLTDPNFKKTITIWVPSNLKDKYISHWNKYKSIIKGY